MSTHYCSHSYRSLVRRFWLGHTDQTWSHRPPLPLGCVNVSPSSQCCCRAYLVSVAKPCNPVWERWPTPMTQTRISQSATTELYQCQSLFSMLPLCLPSFSRIAAQPIWERWLTPMIQIIISQSAPTWWNYHCSLISLNPVQLIYTSLRAACSHTWAAQLLRALLHSRTITEPCWASLYRWQTCPLST